MRCTVCGAALRTTKTDLPFKVTDTAIVILKSLPVVQCVKCAEYLIEDAVLRRVGEIHLTTALAINRADPSATCILVTSDADLLRAADDAVTQGSTPLPQIAKST